MSIILTFIYPYKTSRSAFKIDRYRITEWFGWKGPLRSSHSNSPTMVETTQHTFQLVFWGEANAIVMQYLRKCSPKRLTHSTVLFPALKTLCRFTDVTYHGNV